jgi:hypothetical protein
LIEISDPRNCDELSRVEYRSVVSLRSGRYLK